MQSDSNQLIAYVMTHHLKVVKSQADAMDWLDKPANVANGTRARAS
ncbi:hypothetical protein HJ070_23005 [Vibrio parahaemolyticus]|nr:hypothetical protein [Vibrio parahaemolyticus]